MKKRKIKNKAKTIIIFIIILLLISDVILNLIYAGYKSNILPIVAIGYVIIKMNKKNLLIPFIVILLSLSFIGYNLLSPKYHKFEINKKTIKMQVPSFSILEENGHNEYILHSVNQKSKELTNYINGLEQLTCNSTYYYDIKNNVTIEGYNTVVDDKIIFRLHDGDECKNIRDNIKDETYKKFIRIENLDTSDVNKLINNGYTVIKDQNYNTEAYEKFNEKDNAFIRIIYYDNEETIISDITKKEGYYIIESIVKTINSKKEIYGRYEKIEEINGVLYAVNNSSTQKIANNFTN